MSDTDPAAKAKTTLPTFTPVPRKCNRHDGWTPERQLGFIEALADYGSVRAAANSVGMTPEGAYLLRRHPEAEEFRTAWQAALDLGVQRIEDVAMDRALNGVDVPVYSYGKLVGTRTIYNDRLLMFMLRNRAPGRFAADGAKAMNALDKYRLARMKKEWRAEWERESVSRSKADRKRTLASLEAKLAKMANDQGRLLSPETRRLKDAYEQAAERDHAQPFWWDADGGQEVGSDDPPDNAVTGPSEEIRKQLTHRRARPRPDPEDHDGWDVIDPKETHGDD